MSQLSPLDGMADNKPYTTSIAYDGSGNPLYVGHAKLGTAESSIGWRIKKLTWSISGNCTNIQWANGTDLFDKVWNDRATAYVYS